MASLEGEDNILDQGDKEKIEVICAGKTITTRIKLEEPYGNYVILQGYLNGKYKLRTYIGGKFYKENIKDKITADIILKVPCAGKSKGYITLHAKEAHETKELYLSNDIYRKHKDKIAEKVINSYKNVIDAMEEYRYGFDRGTKSY